MKKSTAFSLFLILSAGLNLTAACGSSSNDNSPAERPAVSVTVNPESLSAGPEATTLPLSITANADWSVSSEADWVSVRPSGGLKDAQSTVQVSVKANSDMDARSAVINISASGKVIKAINLTQGFVQKASASVSEIVMGAQESSSEITVTANDSWTLSSEAEWVVCTPTSGNKGETKVTVKAAANSTSSTREAVLTLECGESKSNIKLSQLSDEIVAPEGYSLVWSDEFNGSSLGSEWVAENWGPGHVNNELQTYTSGKVDGKSTLEVKDGFLYINCFKGADGKVYSGRINAKPSTGWLYGYFEARINLPAGKGTWPAFWMMPSNVDWNSNPWPRCGEIDIMEEVGADPNMVSSSLHTWNYNHTKGTQKTHEMYCAGAEGSFHVYALEWTEDEIITYVDGKVQLRASKAAMGTDHDSWPFHYAFYPILNLAWGGDWGGYKGVDDSVLPVSMKVDYVRIFQKR